MAPLWGLDFGPQPRAEHDTRAPYGGPDTLRKYSFHTGFVNSSPFREDIGESTQKRRTPAMTSLLIRQTVTTSEKKP